MGLFDKTAPKEEEKTSLFGGKKSDEKTATHEAESSALRGAGTGTAGATGGNYDQSSERRASAGTAGGTEAGAGAGGKNTNGSGTATFTFSPADGNDGNEDNGIRGNESDEPNSDNGLGTDDAPSSAESSSSSRQNSRPSWLDKPKEEKKEKPPQDIKIQKGSNRKPKNEGLMSEEQVKIIFTGIFDGIALIKGEHWKLDKSELEIIPALTRVLNRIVDALPKGVAKHTFNVMDYVVIISCVAAIVMKRVNHGKKGEPKNGVIQERKTGTADAGTNAIQIRSESGGGTISQPANGTSGNNQRIPDGFTSTAPIKDLAQSISSIR